MKIKEYPKTQTLELTDSFVVETDNGTKRVEFGDIKSEPETISTDPYIIHRNTYRGKNLGTTFTDEQKEAIRTGTFEDIYVGDYWSDGSTEWVIMDINYLNTLILDSNSITIMPRTILYKYKYNLEKNTTGYGNSSLRSAGLNTAKNMINSFFGSNNIVIYKDALSTSQSSTLPHINAYIEDVKCSVEIPSLSNIFDTSILGSGGWDSTAGYDSYDAATCFHWFSSERNKFKAFDLNPKLILQNNEHAYWVKDSSMTANSNMVVQSSHSYIYIHDSPKNIEYGVRPYFHVKG